MKLSIIIPVYNAEKYVSRCLESVLSLSKVEWECILIDDGSTDRTSEILDEYVNKSKRMRVLHLQNGGVSNARNIGIDNAQGDVCFFLDADDWFSQDADELFHREVNAFKESSLVVFAYQSVTQQGGTSRKLYPNYTGYSFEDKIKDMIALKSSLNTCWGKLFSKRILEQYNIQFDVHMKIGEDASFVIEYLHHVNDIKICNNIILNYWTNPKGAMGTVRLDAIKYTEKTFRQRVELLEKYDIKLNAIENSKMCSKYVMAYISYCINEGKYSSIRILKEKVNETINMQHVNDFIRKSMGRDLGLKNRILLRLLKCKFVTAYSIAIKFIGIAKKYA